MFPSVINANSKLSRQNYSLELRNISQIRNFLQCFFVSVVIADLHLTGLRGQHDWA